MILLLKAGEIAKLNLTPLQKNYRAYSTALVSRMTVTLIWPG